MTIAPIVITSISDLVVGSNSEDTTFSLSGNFDDPSTTGQIAQFQLYNTSLGNGVINIVLFDQAGQGAPLTVANFLNYVNDNDYVNSIIHRSVSDSLSIIQGGGFTINNLTVGDVPTDAPIQNEYSSERLNERGTIAMAKREGDPNSATSQWFFNSGDNSSILDERNNGGFSVFGQVLSNADLSTIDAIAALSTFNYSNVDSAFTDLPLLTNSPTQDNHLVRFRSITVSQVNELNFTVTGNSNPSLVNVTVEGLNLRLDYQPNQVGTAAITVRATSLLGLTIEDTFTITVSDSGFDPAQYGASYLDLILAFGYNLEALTQHYNDIGQAEGRSADLFDEKAYLASYDDLLNAFGTDTGRATEHYIRSGAIEGRTITFNATQYLASYDDLIAVFGNNPEVAEDHFIQSGWGEGRSRDIFAEDLYLASHGDLIEAFGYDLEAATQHYINFGSQEGRAKNSFDPVAYLNNYEDLQIALGDNQMAATQHYLQYGYAEGRSD